VNDERRPDGRSGRPPEPSPSYARPPGPRRPPVRQLPRGWQAVPPSQVVPPSARPSGPDPRGPRPGPRGAPGAPAGPFAPNPNPPNTERAPRLLTHDQQLLTHDQQRPSDRAWAGAAGSTTSTAPTWASSGARTGGSSRTDGGFPPGSPRALTDDDDTEDGGGRRGRRPARERGERVPPSRWRRVRRIAYLVVGFVVLAPVLAFAIGWLLFRVPPADEAANNQVATISYANGSSLATLVPEDGNRIKVPITQVPLHVQQAVLAAEDRSFYTNYGFDPVGIARAAFNQAQGGVGGGSTITQQYVKNVLVGDEYSLWRKYREVVIAAKVSQEQSKEEVLGNYLNTIYFGRGAYGIQAASQAYFAKDVSALTPSEGAVLAGLIQAPSKWDPAVNRAMSQQRWTFVLDGMVSQRWLAPSDRGAAVFPATIPPQPRRSGIPADDKGHVVTAVRDELTSYGITEQQVNQEGLQVTTTIDPKMQRQAADAATKTLDGQPANLRTALVSQEPTTGAILAYYGGQDGNGFDYAQTQRQPGSSFKPFVLLAALERTPPIGLGTTFDGSSPQTIAGTKIANSEGESCANCDLRTAMTLSINTVFYQLGVQVGPQKVADAAHQAGIAAPLPDPSGGISIGDKEVRPGDMASAYATFAAKGVYHRPHLVTRVVTADGRVLYDAGAPRGEPRMSEQLARNVVESMLEVADHSKVGLSGGRPVAAKTGTVQSSVEGQNQDAWMVGATPQLSTAVWIGTDDNSPIKNSSGRPIYGRGVSGQIWQTYMNDALRGKRSEQFGDFVALGTPPQAPTPTPTAPPGQICVDGVCQPYAPGQPQQGGQDQGQGGQNNGGQNNGGQNNGGQGNGNAGNPNGGNPGATGTTPGTQSPEPSVTKTPPNTGG